MKKDIIIKALNFLSKNNGTYKTVEFRTFLLKNFPDNENFLDRKEMKHFITFLTDSNFATKKSISRGIEITIEAGKKVERNEISVELLLTSEGYKFLKANKFNNINIASIFISLIFGATTIILTLANINSEKANSELKMKVNQIQNDIRKLKQSTSIKSSKTYKRF